jgi:hypothetical protein
MNAPRAILLADFLLMGGCCTRTAPARTCPSAAGAPVERKAPSGVIHAGPLDFAITISRTAQLFYIVDQMSEWSKFCHPQYKWWADSKNMLGEKERALLQMHLGVRQGLRVHGYGPLEAAFFTTVDLDEALRRAEREHILTKDDVAAEREVLSALLRRRTLWSRRDAPALREIVRLFRDGFADHTGRLDHGLIAT